jgi:hypothetical protein
MDAPATPLHTWSPSHEDTVRQSSKGRASHEALPFLGSGLEYTSDASTAWLQPARREFRHAAGSLRNFQAGGSPRRSCCRRRWPAANCALRYRHGTKCTSCRRWPPRTVHFDTARVSNAPVAVAGRRELCTSIPPRYQMHQVPPLAAANCALRYPHGIKCTKCRRWPLRTVHFDTARVSNAPVAVAGRRELCTSIPPRYQMHQLPSLAAANCALQYPHGIKCTSCRGWPPRTVRFDTATVSNAPGAAVGRRELCTSIPPRYQIHQLPSLAAANCALRYRHGSATLSLAWR